MLVTLREVLKDAQEKRYRVGLINTVKLEVVTATSVASIKMDIPTRITGRRPTRSEIGP